MRSADIGLCIACVLLVSVGQVLLRAASITAGLTGRVGLQSFFTGTALLAVCVYGSAMLLWVYVLSRVPLTQAFAFFGLSFFVVPALASRFLGDPVTVHTWIGAAIIMLGILVTNWPR